MLGALLSHVSMAEGLLFLGLLALGVLVFELDLF